MDTHDAKLSPTALSIADAARLLSAAGGQPVTVAMLEADVAAGAPTNADGTLNLVHYGAWLAKQLGDAPRGSPAGSHPPGSPDPPHDDSPYNGSV
ncbi:MAG TPA: hypothetical protein PLP66_12535 [Phycisphaerae bacterium]|nr:hypothetical protein [Phycisphaerae bacterium]